MEKINLTEMANKWTRDIDAFSVIAHVLSEDEFFNLPRNDKNEFIVEVEFKINGKEHKFSKFIKELMQSYEDHVNNTAKELIKDEVDSYIGKINNAIEEIKESLNNEV